MTVLCLVLLETPEDSFGPVEAQICFRVHTGKYEYNSRTFQGLLKTSPTVFKDLKLMKNTDLSVKTLL